MNAWQVADEANINIAIPADIVSKAIDAAQRAREMSRQLGPLTDTLLKTAKRLANELGSSRPDATMLSSLVSYTFVSQRPQVMAADLQKLLTGQMTADERQQFVRSPVEYSRETLLRLFRLTFATGTSSIDAVKFDRVVDLDEVTTTKPVRSIYKVADKSQDIFWTWEHGTWRIADVSFDQWLLDKLNEIDKDLLRFGVIIDLASGAISATISETTTTIATPKVPEASATTSKAPGLSATKKDSELEHGETLLAHRTRGSSIMVRVSEGRRGAVGDSFRDNLQQKSFSSFGIEIALPFNRYFWFTVGLGYGPLGVAYQATEGNRTLLIDERPSYLQLPLLFRLEIPLETRYATLRLFGKAGLTGDLLTQRDGTFRDVMTGATGSLDDPHLDWFADHRRYNVGTVYGGGIEIGLGASPSIYLGAEVVSEEHLLKEWGANFFDGAENYRYRAMLGSVFIKYQSLR